MPESQEVPDIRDIIDHANEDLLRSFLRKHAGRNTGLALKLRAHLVEGMRATAGVNKYSQVLGLLVKHDVQGTIRLTKRSVQILREICEQFILFQQQLLHLGELRDAWDNISSVIHHLHLMMDKYHGPDAKLVEQLKESYDHAIDLLHRSPAPELKRKIHAFFLELIQRRHHVLYDVQMNAISSLILSSTGRPDLKVITAIITGKMEDTVDATDVHRRMWAAVSLKLPLDQNAIENFISADEAYDIAYLLFTAKDSKALSKLLETIPTPASLSYKQRIQWVKWRFDHALVLGGGPEITRAGLELLVLDQDINTYRKLTSAVSSAKIALHIENVEISDELRANIYAEEKQWPTLMALIEKTASLPLLNTHLDALFYHTDPQFSFIRDVTTNYAQHQAGVQSIEQVGLLFQGLKQQRQDAIAQALAEQLLADFPDRFDAVIKIRQKKKSSRQQADLDTMEQ